MNFKDIIGWLVLIALIALFIWVIVELFAVSPLLGLAGLIGLTIAIYVKFGKKRH